MDVSIKLFALQVVNYRFQIQLLRCDLIRIPVVDIR
jgi:hypothetical protein